MTILVQNNSVLGDNTHQAIPTFKKLLSISSTNLANSKGYHSKHINFCVNVYKRDKKYNKRSSRHKH